MSRNFPAINGLAASLRQLAGLSGSRSSSAGEARLYLQRALKAAAEERFDVALVFCGKALDVEPGNLGARLLAGRLYDHARGDVDRAVEAYRKVISLAGYDESNPYCAAARQALDALVATRSPASLSEACAPES
jgi:tetratricopeptide (TPR) repeat protein